MVLSSSKSFDTAYASRMIRWSTVKLGVMVNPNDKTYFDRFYVCLNGLKKVVNVENKDNWSWFLELLGDDIDFPTGNGLTLMSYQHKGLIEAVKEDMPYTEHRQSSKATYLEQFNKIMDRIKRANPMAHQYLIKKEPKTWSKAHFEQGCNCEAVENRNLFEVKNKNEAFKVNEQLRTCGCRMWQLLGLPCPHAIAVLFKINKRPEDYVVACFRKGRPMKKRIKASHENKNNNRVSKAGVQMTCQNCFQNGHNKKSCVNAKVVKAPKPPYVNAQAELPNMNSDTPNVIDDNNDFIMGSGTITGAGIAMRNSRIQRSKSGMCWELYDLMIQKKQKNETRGIKR
nr:hypothetical protein [Tanacetum cinerariifolium]